MLPTANHYFMAASTFVIALLGTWITHKVVEPRFEAYHGEVAPEHNHPLSPVERKTLKKVLWVSLAWLMLLAATLIPESGFFRGPGNSLLRSPLLKGFIALLVFAAGSLGLFYVVGIGKYKRDADVVKGMTESFKSLAAFMVLVFFAAQFVAWFRLSHSGLIIAIEGADFLQRLNLGRALLIVLFMVLSGFINLFMGSASAKWTILGPVFIPILCS